MLDPRWWNRRIGLLITLTGLVGGTMGALGGRIVWPGDAVREATTRNAEQDTAIAHLRISVDSLGKALATNTFLICVLVKRSQPNGAMPIKECP